MIMRFRGGGVGHSSTRAATDLFKDDRDTLDMESRRARQNKCDPTNVEEEEDYDDIYMDSDLREGSEAGEAEDEEDELSESELVDYGYEQEEEEEEHGDMEEDDTIIDELGALDFADY
jgi:hypothetical protein